MRLSTLASALLILSAMSGAAVAQDAYPSKPIRFIVPFAPGGGADISARVIAMKMGAAMGQTVVVENRPGAGGVIGTDMVAKAPADGYTILLGTIGPIAINPSLYKKLSYNVDRDFTPISLVGNALNVLVVNPTLPVKTVPELISYAKTHPVAFGSSGNGATDHLAGEMFNSLTGLSMLHVAYKGGVPAMTDLMANQVQLVFSTVSTAAGAIKAGKVMPIAMTGSTRFKGMPDIPTIKEAGVPAFEVNNWYGVLVPRDTPAPIVARLNTELVAALKTPEVTAKLLESGIEPAWTTPNEFGSYIKSETTKWARVVADSGATVQ
ncbi:Bug family tripartite tricarboxylate transporter substrate binding protein [Pigmentiphaga litoralis]|uniref:Tripartite-type tricarboxylate transporter receptor subunit TctC n=1 Tax=Pigmentiphaga litoralis TaxID=516702 RepID=A0A7Y9LLT4_9BURK|nr:tripartite tricarboxylate transporter substrate binding protein [Pigmentiphaga litoralis]NYE25492.1 tripartite-type tricarboxylate transporter receptor subunit TctC [Pigmentiphaga litoralis]NYE80896.1 tripartite-type tricarboxylate transporter receptor subunit TctC [Pigmentiphaga litoralis]